MKKLLLQNASAVLPDEQASALLLVHYHISETSRTVFALQKDVLEL